MMARHLRITGRVQGVGYREAMRREAVARGVTGWVRNRMDGAVEAVVQGDSAAIDALISWARIGPPGALVQDVSVSPPLPGDEIQAAFLVQTTT